MWQGPVATAVGGNTYNRGLHKVVEAAEEIAKHPCRSYNPDSRAWKLALQEDEGVLKTPRLPLADLLELILHSLLQILQPFTDTL